MWLFLFVLYSLFIVEQASGGSLNKKVPVSDNDSILQQIIYKSGALYTNSKLPHSETNWWIPIPGHPFRATVVRNYNRRTRKYYATYNYFPVNARSLCNKNTVALSALKNCVLETPLTQRQECNLMFAWIENEWSTAEIEGTCDIKMEVRSEMKTLRKQN
uniref:Secreted protein n=1 Tax=Onchocerca volvulus TaxID=6282 RepID=A0A8R1XKK3_ONCVO